MSTQGKDIQAAILNEGNSEVERLAIRIVKLPGGGITFLKTFAYITNQQDRTALRLLGDEILPTANRGFLGIGVTSYANANYIEFYSAFKSLQLNKEDEITLMFEDSELKFAFNSLNKSFGYMKRNSCFITESAMEYMTDHKLESWKLVCKDQNLTVLGGFDANDFNNQYKSTKAGQRLLQGMVKEVLSLKPALVG